VAIEHAAGNSGALTMERRSRRADGLARSLSRAGGINETGAKGEISPLASQLSLLELKMRKVVSPKADKGLGGRLPFAGGSFDLATSRNRPIHETTNCPRKPRNTHLHSSKWLGTSTLELWPWPWALYRAAVASHTPPPFRTELGTDSRQLGYAREQSALLATRVPEARRTEDLGEGAYRMRKRRINGVHMTWSTRMRKWALDMWRPDIITIGDAC
jgi:hypothetical protein